MDLFTVAAPSGRDGTEFSFSALRVCACLYPGFYLKIKLYFLNRQYAHGIKFKENKGVLSEKEVSPPVPIPPSSPFPEATPANTSQFPEVDTGPALVWGGGGEAVPGAPGCRGGSGHGPPRARDWAEG